METDSEQVWFKWQCCYHDHDSWGFMMANAVNLYGTDQRSAVGEMNFVHQTNWLTLIISLGTQQFDSHYLSDINYLSARISLDWRKWHLFLDSNLTDRKSDSAAYSRNWKTHSSGIGLDYSFQGVPLRLIKQGRPPIRAGS